jgi:hypothetical protein
MNDAAHVEMKGVRAERGIDICHDCPVLDQEEQMRRRIFAASLD